MSELWLIDANDAFEFLTEKKVKETGVQSKAFNRALDIARSAVRNQSAIPTIDPEELPIVQELRAKLERYEQAEEEGRLVVLPARFGQEVYHITTCKNFVPVADGTLYDGFGGPGTATGCYCPCELLENCPFESDDFQCEKFANTPAIFKDVVETYAINDFEDCVMLQYSGSCLFEDFGKTVFLTHEEAAAALKERENDG